MTTDPEELRRRLYRPGAAEADVAAFVAARPDPVEPPTPVPAPARRRSRLLIAPLVVVLVVAGGGVAWGLGGATRVPSPGATPLPTASVDPAARAAFVRSLVEGRDAGLRAWLAQRGTAALEAAGTGQDTVELPPSDDDGPGRLTVYLVLESDAETGWAPARLVIHDDRTIHLEAGRELIGTALAGIPAVATSRYRAGERPLRVIVQAPEGVRWGLAAVFDHGGAGRSGNR